MGKGKKDLRLRESLARSSHYYFCDDTLKREVLKKENLSSIEHLLSDESKKLCNIEEKGHIDEITLDCTDSFRNEHIIKEVFSRVDFILGINHIIPPLVEICDDNSYDPNLRRIRLKNLDDFFLVPYAAHEYTHHVCEMKHYPKGGIFCEGYAIMVERDISEQYREKTEDYRFIYEITQRTVGELKAIYLWSCRKNNMGMNTSLLCTESDSDQTEKDNMKACGRPTEHAIGNAFFLIKSLKRGNSFYKELVLS